MSYTTCERRGWDAPCSELGELEAALAKARRELEDIEGKLLYCEPRKCLPCVAGLACEGMPTCDSRERNHADALAIVRAALGRPAPDGETHSAT